MDIGESFMSLEPSSLFGKMEDNYVYFLLIWQSNEVIMQMNMSCRA